MQQCRTEQENREFLRAGTVAAAVYNVYRDTQVHRDPFSAYDIFDLPRPPKPLPSKEEIAANIDAFFSRHNSDIERARRRREKRKQLAGNG